MTMVGTPYYLSPEICEEKPYCSKTDVWSMGCVLYELCTYKHPFDAQTQVGLFNKILKANYDPLPPTVNKDLSYIVSQCL